MIFNDLAMEVNCFHCGKETYKTAGHYNRAIKTGAKMFCSKKCFSDSRKTSKADKVEKKRLYDIEYRKKNLERITESKKRYYQENYEEIYAKQKRKRDNDESRKKHAEYCSGLEYRRKERIRRYIRLYGENWQSNVKYCISCEKEKFMLEFEHSPIFPDNRRHICNDCEEYQNKIYGYSTRLTLAAMKSRRYTNLMWEDFAKHPYLIEANKFLILLKRELR